MNLENHVRIEETDCRDHRMASKEDGKPATKHASNDKVNQFECVCVCVTCSFWYSCVQFTNMCQVVIGLLQHLSLLATTPVLPINEVMFAARGGATLSQPIP